MKERKVLRLCYLAGMYLSFLVFLASVSITIYTKDVVFLIESIPFFVYGVLLLDLWSKETLIKKHAMGGGALMLAMCKMMEDLKRYEELYGKLPEEEKKEEGTNEEKKAE